MRKINIFIATLLMTVAVAGQSPFVDYMKSRSLTLPVVISYKEFLAVAMKYAMTEDDLQQLFVQLEIPIKGEDDGRYLLGADLLSKCGAECELEEGLGYMLRGFLYPANRDR